MGLGQIGMFLPSESQYLKPGTYEDTLKGQATKVATYLASMDQFYENLGEAKRQYDLTLSWQKESFGKQLSFEQEKFGKTFGLQERVQTSTEKYNESMLKLKQQEINLESRKIYNADVAQKNQLSSQDLLKFMKENSVAERQNAIDIINAQQTNKRTAGSSGSGLVDFSMVANRLGTSGYRNDYIGEVSGIDYSGT